MKTAFQIVKEHEGRSLSTQQIHYLLGPNRPTLATVRRHLWSHWYQQPMQQARNQNYGEGGLNTIRRGRARMWWWEPQCPECKGHSKTIYITDPTKKPRRCLACRGRGIRPERTLT